MKVLLNITCFRSQRPTGIERFALQLAREYRKLDPSAIVVAGTNVPGIPDAVVSPCLHLCSLFLKGNEYVARALWDQTVLRRIVARNRLDAVFFPIHDGMLFPQTRQVVTVHDLHYHQFGDSVPDCDSEIGGVRRGLYQWKMPHVLARSAAIAAISETTKSDLVNHFGVPAEKIRVVYNGYDENRFRVLSQVDPVLERYRLTAGSYLLFVSSILPHKNVTRLVTSFAQIDNGIKLVVAGGAKDAKAFGAMMTAVRENGLTPERFRYLDYVPDEDLPYLYSGALAFVLPSLHEGFGVPLIEAMACGTPVITSDCSAMPEVAGGAAVLVNPLDTESISAAMKGVVANEGLRREMRVAGLQLVKKFRWAASAEALQLLFRTAAGK